MTARTVILKQSNKVKIKKELLMKKFFVLLVATALSTMLYAEKGSSNGQPFLTLQGQIDKLVGDANTVEDRLTGLEAATLKLEDEVVVLKDDVATLVVELDNLYTIVDGDAEATQEAIDALKKDIEKNTLDIDSNLDMIAVLGDEIIVIKENMELKQNIINGVCPDGQALVAVNTDENDAVMICETVSGAGDFLQTVKYAYTGLSPNKTTTLTAQCPAGYISSGGGFHTRSTDIKVLASQPMIELGLHAWEVTAKNESQRFYLIFRSKVNCLKLQ